MYIVKSDCSFIFGTSEFIVWDSNTAGKCVGTKRVCKNSVLQMHLNDKLVFRRYHHEKEIMQFLCAVSFITKL